MVKLSCSFWYTTRTRIITPSPLYQISIISHYEGQFWLHLSQQRQKRAQPACLCSLTATLWRCDRWFAPAGWDAELIGRQNWKHPPSASSPPAWCKAVREKSISFKATTSQAESGGQRLEPTSISTTVWATFRCPRQGAETVPLYWQRQNQSVAMVTDFSRPCWVWMSCTNLSDLEVVQMGGWTSLLFLRLSSQSKLSTRPAAAICRQTHHNYHMHIKGSQCQRATVPWMWAAWAQVWDPCVPFLSQN